MRLLHFTFIIALASGLAAILIYIAGVSKLYGTEQLSDEDLEALQALQSGFQKCVVEDLAQLSFQTTPVYIDVDEGWTKDWIVQYDPPDEPKAHRNIFTGLVIQPVGKAQQEVPCYF